MQDNTKGLEKYFEKHEKTIFDFKPQDQITRIKGAIPYIPGGTSDKTYIGKRITFLGVRNGLIYIQAQGEGINTLHVELFYGGWSFYQHATL